MSGDGGPAFARPAAALTDTPAQSGMSLRDWFAGQALVGFLASREAITPLPPCSAVAARVYEIADAMLKERGL